MLSRTEATTNLQDIIDDPCVYSYLKSTDLTENQINETIETYRNQANTYSNHEWSSQSVRTVWESIFSKLKNNIEELPPDSRVLFAGCGTLKDLVALNLWRKDLSIFGFDISTEMLNAGLEKLSFPEIMDLATTLDRVESAPHIWISNVLRLIEQIDEPEISQITEDHVVRRVKSKIHLVQGDIRVNNSSDLMNEPHGYFFPQESFQLIMAIASLPHVSKRNASESIIEMLRLLRIGGILHFNLKIDTDSDRKKGRVFCDNVLGGNRYFNTYTMSEFMQFIANIQLFYPNVQVDVDYSLSKHPNRNKPPYINVTMTRT